MFATNWASINVAMQVIKVRVVKVDLDHRRLSLGLASKKSKAAAEAAASQQLPLEPGEVSSFVHMDVIMILM